MIAVVPVTGGALPAGALDAALESDGEALVAGEDAATAAAALAAALGEAGVRARVRSCELGSHAPARFARAVADLVAAEAVVILPASPDGRDLAPRLAAELGRPLLGVATRVTATGAVVLRAGGRQLVGLEAAGPFVATLLPGVVAPPARRVAPALATGRGEHGEPIEEVEPPPDEPAEEGERSPVDPVVLAVLEPDPETVDLAEAGRILAGGAGLGGAEQFALAAAVAARLEASLGGTRVVTDAGVLGHDRQIGTTGVAVNPRLYLAFGISGAAQHVGGLGTPEHVVSVNLDASCPMMAMADVAIVADAEATLSALARKIGVTIGE